MSISADTKVFVSTLNGRERWWLGGANNKFNPAVARLVLMGDWVTADKAKSLTLDAAIVARRRFLDETNCPVDFSLSAGSLDFVESENLSKSGEPDARVPMSYRGLLAVPGVDVKSGEKVWYIRIFENGMQQDSVKGSSIEEVVQNVFDRKLEGRAQRAPLPAAPAETQQQPVAPAGPRLRPGSLR